MKYELLLESDNLKYVKPLYELIDEYLIMVNDKENQKYISKTYKEYSREDEEGWVKEKLESGCVFTILEKDTDKFVGNIELMDMNDETAEVGACLTRTMQDKHYGTEAEKRILKYAFEELKLKYLTAGVFDYNGRSLHCAKKVGFVETGRTDEEGMFGKFQEIHLKMTKEDYENMYK